MNLMTTTRTLAMLALGVGLAVNGHAQSFLTNGLVAYFPFNGNANDESGNGDNGTVYGATLSPDRLGTPNRAYYFNATLLNAIETSGTNLPIGTAEKSFSCWFKLPSPFLNSGVLWSCGQNNPESFLGGRVFYENGTQIGLQVMLWTTSYHKYFTNLGDERWHHYVVSITNNSLVSAHLDGQIITFQTSPPPGTQINLGAGPFFMGYGAGQYYTGWLDDVRIYNRALSADEVAMLYEYESGPRVDLIKAVKPSFTGLYIGTNYQLQLSGDLNTWTNHGSPFSATNTRMVYPQYWDVDNWGSLFFRLKTPL
jgi:hypothetical protein